MKNPSPGIRASRALLLLLASLTPCSAKAAWESVGAAGFSSTNADYESLAIDASDRPYVAYRDNAVAGKATVMRYTGAGWEAVGPQGFTAGAAYYTSIALDAAGTPFVTFFDGAHNGKTTVMKYDAGWVAVGNPGFSSASSFYQDIAIDSGGTPVVAYRDGGNGNEASVLRFDGMGWQYVGGAGISPQWVVYTSLAIDSTDNPCVAYGDYSVSGGATVRHFDGVAWQTVGTTGFSAGEALYTSLALDSSDRPYVAYRDNGNGGKATVMRYNGSAWENVGAAGFSAGEAEYTSLALDADDTPIVAYGDAANGARLTVMRFDGAAWHPVGDVGFSAGTASFIDLALDSSGNPLVAFRDGANGDAVTVMRYVPPPLDDFTCYKAGATRGSTKFAGIENPPGVALVDRFGSATVAVSKPKYLCAPTDKNGENVGAELHTEHLKGYRINLDVKPVLPANLHVVDQFNPGGLLVEARKASHLLVPTLKSLTDPVPTPASGSLTIDHFECYKVGPAARATKFVPVAAVSLEDQLGTMSVDVRKPKFLCNPVNKNGEDPTAPTHTEHLMCYGVKQVDAAKFVKKVGVYVNNQFGPEQVDVKKPSELCVPAAVEQP